MGKITSPHDNTHTHTHAHTLTHVDQYLLGLHLKIAQLSMCRSVRSPLWLNSSVSSVSAEVITAEDSVDSWLSRRAMVVTLRRSTALSHSAMDKPGKSLGNDTVPSTCNTHTECSGEVIQHVRIYSADLHFCALIQTGLLLSLQNTCNPSDLKTSQCKQYSI